MIAMNQSIDLSRLNMEEIIKEIEEEAVCYIQAHLSGNYISTVISSPNYTSLPSMASLP